ncbi:MAG: ATP-binding protein, partial [Bacteroidota bacterium]
TQTKIKLKSLPPQVVANKTKFKQIFQNLIANAIKFRKKTEECVIEISGQEDENFWYFTVADNGIGIKQDFYDKIFELFKKLHAKSEYQGSGIGLAVCKRIVEQHGGAIWVESEVDKGTRFHFSFSKQKADA